MNLKPALLWVPFLGIAATSYSITARSSEVGQQYNSEVLAQVEFFYGISEEAAKVRLDKEYEASVLARRIEELQLPGYAGLWFDAPTLTLHVGVSRDADADAVEERGAIPVRVAWALSELEGARERLTSTIDSALGTGVVHESYIDFQANSLVIGVAAEDLEQAAEFLKAHSEFKVPVQLAIAQKDIGFSTNLSGADGTQNYTWHIDYGGTWPCSVGASAEKVAGSSYVVGYVTAGHCNTTKAGVGNTIWTIGGASLGQVVWSSFDQSSYTFANNEDGAFVKTDSGWTPQSKVNGYSSGALTVSGTWGGTLAAPVGTTACRYGENSGGPHCASVSARNVTVCFKFCDGVGHAPVNINGLIKVSGICTNDGDSGGPLVTAANQVQGTVSGGTANSCPDSSGDVVYFQPVSTTLSRASSTLSNPVVMLTSHGRSAPTFSTTCPDPGSASGHFICILDSYDSQGEATMSWSTSTGKTSTTSSVSGACSAGYPVNVTLSLTNPYGTTTSTSSFLCPSGPPI